MMSGLKVPFMLPSSAAKQQKDMVGQVLSWPEMQHACKLQTS
jgi:hypothetical protein